MKSIFILFALLALLCPLTAINTGKSILFADSYMLRAQGVEAAYWNPANLVPQKYIDLWVPGLNTGVSVTNNALDLDTYNYIMGQSYLTDSDKDLLLNKIKGSLRAEMEGNSSVIGFSVGNMSFSSSLHYMSKLALSRQYLDLLLYGNTDTLYVFDKSNTDVQALSYLDFTFGAGNFTIPNLPEGFPAIRAGFSISALLGLGNAYTENFNGYLHSDWEGMTLHQDLTLRTGVGGYGQKAMLGLACDVTPDLQVGLTLDNLFGKITWSAVAEDLNYHFAADTLYVANIDQDFYQESHDRVTVDQYFTELPPELRMAALYTQKQFSVSADYVQAFKSTVSTSSVGRLALGLQYLPLPFLPLNFGLGIGNSEFPWRASYGFGLKIHGSEFGISVQSVDALIPGQKSKGVSFGTYIRLWI